jgi:hypothetical protein
LSQLQLSIIFSLNSDVYPQVLVDEARRKSPPPPPPSQLLIFLHPTDKRRFIQGQKCERAGSRKNHLIRFS